jgi:hypothetical protein
VLDPVADDRAQLLGQLSSTSAIQDPELCFKNFATPSSLALLKEQLTNHKQAVDQAAERKDLSLIKFKLDQMRTLLKLQLQDCDAVYATCTATLETLLKAAMKEASARLKQYMRCGNDDSDEAWLETKLKIATVRILPGQLSGLSVFLCESILYGAFVWAHRALDTQNRRFPARAVDRIRKHPR